ncbi:MAG: LytS/YhcK type 5TM receptor domain-containing protein [Bacteroidales bacterium]|nr:LytS/YhcK type 5TM receptor domain-containing protein [Bacteroidales bacterium]
MNEPVVIGILQNIAVLFALSIVFEYFKAAHSKERKFATSAFIGLLLGGICILLMLTPWIYIPGITFDTRSILLSVSGLFFGAIPTLIAMLIAAIYRIYVGGTGVYMGLAVIISSGFIGILWKKYLFKLKYENSTISLLSMGLVVHTTMLACTLLLPVGTIWTTLKVIALPVLVFYPIGSLLLGKLLLRQSLNWETKSALKDSEKKYRTLFSSMNEGFALHELIFDSAGKAIDYTIMDVNPAFETILGIKKKMVVGKASKIAYQVSEPPYFSRYSEVANGGNSIIFQDYFEPMDKHFLVSVFSPSKGKFATLFSDVTELRKMEAEVQREQELLSVIFDNLEEGIVVCDENGILKRFNESTRRFHGLPEKPIPANKWADYYDLYMPDGKTPMKKEDIPLFRALYEGEVKNAELTIIPKNSEPLSFIANGRKMVDNKGVTIGAVATMHNITEKKKIEAKLKDYQQNLEKLVENRTTELEEQTQKLRDSQTALTYLLEDVNESREQLKSVNKQLENSNIGLDSFTYSVSHDLRAPLRAMQGLSKALLEDYSEVLDDLGKNYSQRIVASAEQMDKLIMDLLQYSRLSRVEIALDVIEIVPIIDKVIKLLRDEIKKKDAKIIIKTKLPAVKGNQTMLEQPILNLIENALKFTEPGKKPVVEIWHEETDNQLSIFIKDNGIGIPQEYHEKIFKVLERLHGVEAYPGTGIGLSIVKKCIERIGGTVELHSEENKGSTFILKLKKS